jgi:hypothetical protein
MVPPTYISAEERVAEDILVRGWLASRPDTRPRAPGGPSISRPPPELRLRVVQAGIQERVPDTGRPVDAIAVATVKGSSR